jgi:hypothetical protein
MEQVRRRVNFRGGRRGLAACRQNAPVRQQQRSRVIASKNCVTRHGGPRAGRGIPQLRRVYGIGRVTAWELISSASAGHQDFAIRKQCSGVESASSGHHRASILPSGTGTVQVNDFRGCRWIGSAISVRCTWASTHEQYLAIVVHH